MINNQGSTQELKSKSERRSTDSNLLLKPDADVRSDGDDEKHEEPEQQRGQGGRAQKRPTHRIERAIGVIVDRGTVFKDDH